MWWLYMQSKITEIQSHVYMFLPGTAEELWSGSLWKELPPEMKWYIEKVWFRMFWDVIHGCLFIKCALFTFYDPNFKPVV